MKGELKGDVAINMLCQLKENQDFEYPLEPDQGQYLFQRACLEAFTESNDPQLDNPKVKPLGLYAQNLVIAMTGDYFILIESGLMPYMVPTLNVYGKIEQAYLDLNREA